MTGTDALKLFDVRDTPLSVDEVINAVADPRAGGVAVFIGMVRNHDGEQARDDGKLVGHSGEHLSDFPGASGGDSSVVGSVSSDVSSASDVSDAFGAHRSTVTGSDDPDATNPEATGLEVTGLEYVAHPTALAMLRETAEKVLAEHRVTALAAVHRTGQLAVGDLAVVCAASAAHRGEAFAACRSLIDTLKAQVPIWKREQFEDGSHIWVGC